MRRYTGRGNNYHCLTNGVHNSYIYIDLAIIQYYILTLLYTISNLNHHSACVDVSIGISPIVIPMHVQSSVVSKNLKYQQGT